MASLQRQAISSVKWTTLKTGLVAATGPVLQIIKTRFLSPEGFAHIAIVMIFIGLFRTFENFGISQAIIQRDSIETQETASLFFFNIILAFIFGLILFFLSPFISGFFSLPKLNYLLKITSLIVVVGGPSHLFRAFMEKQMQFKELSLIEITRNIFMLIIVTLLLYFGFGVIGVIYGNLLSTLLSTLLIAFFCIKKRLVKLSLFFSIKKIYPFLRFGIFVSGKQIMTFFAHHLDELLIGYFLAPEALGIYYFGKNMLEKLRGLITASFSKVLFPVFSKLKHDMGKLSIAYQKISTYIAFISFPIFTGIAVTARLFVPLIFGEQWVESVIVFQVFSLALLLMVLTANVSTSLLYSVNKPGTVFYIDIITNAIYFITLGLFASQGVIAVLLVYSLYVVYKTLTLQYFTNKQLIQRFSTYLFQLIPAASLSVVMVLGVLFFQNLTLSIMTTAFQFLGSIFLGAFIYIALGLILQKNTVKEIKSALMKGTTVGI